MIASLTHTRVSEIFLHSRLRCGYQNFEQCAPQLHHCQPTPVRSMCHYIGRGSQSPKLIFTKLGQSTTKPLNALRHRFYMEFFQFGNQRGFFVVLLRSPTRAKHFKQTSSDDARRDLDFNQDKTMKLT